MFGNIRIDREERTVSYGPWSFQFLNMPGGNKRFEVISFMILAGACTKQQIFDHLFGDDPEGGPESGMTWMNVVLNQCNRINLKPIGLEIRSWRMAGKTWHEIVPRDQPPDRQRYTERKSPSARLGQQIPHQYAK